MGLSEEMKKQKGEQLGLSGKVKEWLQRLYRSRLFPVQLSSQFFQQGHPPCKMAANGADAVRVISGYQGDAPFNGGGENIAAWIGFACRFVETGQIKIQHQFPLFYQVEIPLHARGYLRLL